LLKHLPRPELPTLLKDEIRGKIATRGKGECQARKENGLKILRPERKSDYRTDALGGANKRDFLQKEREEHRLPY